MAGSGPGSPRAGETRRSARPSRRLSLTPRRFDIWVTPGRAGAAAARVLYQPRNRARIAASVVARVLPGRPGRSGPPPDIQSIVEHLAELAGARVDAAAALNVRSTRRWLYALTSTDGSGVVVKLGNAGDEGLAREAATLATLATLETSIRVPVLRWHGQYDGRFAIVTDIVKRRNASTEPALEDAYTAACALATMKGGFVVHGDLAPWNMVPSPTGLALIDWEDSRFAHDPLYDLAHYVIRSGALLHTWRPRAAIDHLIGTGSVGWKYLSEIDVDPHAATEHLLRYLRRSKSDASSPAIRRYEAAMAETLTRSGQRPV